MNLRLCPDVFLGSNEYASQKGMALGSSRAITQHEDDAVATTVLPQQSGMC